MHTDNRTPQQRLGQKECAFTLQLSKYRKEKGKTSILHPVELQSKPMENTGHHKKGSTPTRGGGGAQINLLGNYGKHIDTLCGSSFPSVLCPLPLQASNHEALAFTGQF